MGLKTYELSEAEREFFRKHRELIQRAEAAMQGALQLIAEQQGFRGACHLEHDRWLQQNEAAAAAPQPVSQPEVSAAAAGNSNGMA